MIETLENAAAWTVGVASVARADESTCVPASWLDLMKEPLAKTEPNSKGLTSSDSGKEESALESRGFPGVDGFTVLGEMAPTQMQIHKWGQFWELLPVLGMRRRALGWTPEEGCGHGHGQVDGAGQPDERC